MDKEVSTYKLPIGWIWTTVGEIGIVTSGGTPERQNASYYNGNIPWVKSGELNFNTIYNTEEKISKEAIQNSSAKIVPANSILIALYGSTVGKLGILGIDASTNQAIASIITTKSFNKEFLYYYLLKNRDKLLQQRKGGAQPNISQKIIIDFSLPLPSFKEQDRIVYKIEELFSELDYAKEELIKAKKQLEIYRQALLKNAFEGKLTDKWRSQTQVITAYETLRKIKNSRKTKYLDYIKDKNNKKPKLDFEFDFSQSEEIETWAEASLNNLIDINARIGWRGLKKDEYTKDGPLLLSVHALNFGKSVVFKDANHISIDRYEESPEIKLEENDILLCKDGAGIGKVAIIKHLPSKSTVNSSLLVIKVKEIFIPDYFYYFLLGPEMQKLVNARISGSAIPHLFQKDIKKFRLKVPPIDEQKQIVQELEFRFTLLENLTHSIKIGLQKIEVFKHTILKKAFEGKLVSQNSNDESAINLLKQIQEEKLEYYNTQKELVKLKPKNKRTMVNYKTVLQILKEEGTPISAKELWQLSIYNDNIDAFYSNLKELIEDGVIIEIERKGKESYLTLNNVE